MYCIVHDQKRECTHHFVFGFRSVLAVMQVALHRSDDELGLTERQHPTSARLLFGRRQKPTLERHKKRLTSPLQVARTTD